MNPQSNGNRKLRIDLVYYENLIAHAFLHFISLTLNFEVLDSMCFYEGCFGNDERHPNQPIQRPKSACVVGLEEGLIGVGAIIR